LFQLRRQNTLFHGAAPSHPRSARDNSFCAAVGKPFGKPKFLLNFLSDFLPDFLAAAVNPF
jgi:hypothetical protein